MKNNARNRIILIALCASLAAPLAACGGTNTNEPGQTAATSAQTTVAETEPETTGPIASYLPATDLNGFELHVSTTQNKEKMIWSEEETGDVLNDAVYASNGLVRDAFNAVIVPHAYGTSSGNVTAYVQQTVASGDTSVDLVNGHDGASFALTMGNNYHDLQKMKYQDFTQPWYPEYANDQYEINGKQYIYSSYMSYQTLAWARAVYFNKQLAKDRNLGNIYALVDGNQWTLDKMLSLARDTYTDVNGDGARDEGDVYGWVGFKKLYGFQSAFVNCYAESKDGVVSMDYDLEKLIDVITKVNDVLNNSAGGYLIGNEPSVKLFSQGSALFYYDTLGNLTGDLMRDSEVDYGIVPVPKYTPEQEYYVTPTFDEQFGVPVTQTGERLDAISLLIEAYSSAGYNTVRSVYFDTVLSSKYARDEDTVRMLAIVGDSLMVDLAYLNTDAGVNGLGRALMYCLTNPNTGVASYIESIKGAEQKRVDRINEFYGQ